MKLVCLLNCTGELHHHHHLHPTSSLLLKHIISQPPVMGRQSCEKTSPVRNVSMETSSWIQLWTKFTHKQSISAALCILQKSFSTFLLNFHAYCFQHFQLF